MFQSTGSVVPTSAGHQSERLIAGNRIDLAWSIHSKCKILNRCLKLWTIFYFPESNINCTSEQFEGYHDLVDDEGNIVDDFNGLSYGSEDKCKQYCFDNDECKSFTYCRNGDTYNCHLKDKVLINKGENKMDSSHHPYCTSYTKTCEGILEYTFTNSKDDHKIIRVGLDHFRSLHTKFHFCLL